jgi:hypothetical protein
MVYILCNEKGGNAILSREDERRIKYWSGSLIFQLYQTRIPFSSTYTTEASSIQIGVTPEEHPIATLAG